MAINMHNFSLRLFGLYCMNKNMIIFDSSFESLFNMGGTASRQALSPEALPTEAEKRVGPFYDALNNPAQKDVRKLVEGITSPEWRSYNSETVSKGRDEFIQQVTGFGKMIPDLKWEVKEMHWIEGANKVVVRSVASGTPSGDFMGVPHSGKSFSVFAIDIHTLDKNGKLIRADHVEDWASALRQLK